MHVAIRKAKPGDASQLAPIMFSAMSEILFYLIGRENEAEAMDLLLHFIALPQNQYSYENIWVAESEEQEILGQACLYDGADLYALRQPILDYVSRLRKELPAIEDETSAGEVYLDTIAVVAAARGLGVGQQLLQHIHQFYIVERQLTVGLLVDHTNPKAKSLYLRTGFVWTEERTFFGQQMDHLRWVSTH